MRLMFLLWTVLPAAAATCDSLATLAIPHATIGSAADRRRQTADQPPAYCRVAGTLKPSADSDIRFEVWMPAAELERQIRRRRQRRLRRARSARRRWRLRSAAVTPPRPPTLAIGGGGTDASWALGHPEKVMDFGYRAIHETAVAAKAAISCVLRRRTRRSRTSIRVRTAAARRSWKRSASRTTTTASSPARRRTTGRTCLSNSDLGSCWHRIRPAAYIPPAKLPAIEAAALAFLRCRRRREGRRHRQPGPMPVQARVATVQRRGLRELPHAAAGHGARKDSRRPARLARGRSFPDTWSEECTGQGGWADWITGNAPGKSLAFGFGTNFFTNMVYEDTSWDYHSVPARSRPVKAADKLALALNATNPDMSKFQRARRQADPVSRLERRRDLADQHHRLLQEPIKQARELRTAVHGSGNAALRRRPGPERLRPEPLARQAIRCTTSMPHWSGGWNRASLRASIVAKKGDRSRPLCPYPQVATYKGSGSTDDAANFVCK